MLVHFNQVVKLSLMILILYGLKQIIELKKKLHITKNDNKHVKNYRAETINALNLDIILFQIHLHSPLLLDSLLIFI
jgi:hypothetical protein